MMNAVVFLSILNEEENLVEIKEIKKKFYFYYDNLKQRIIFSADRTNYDKIKSDSIQGLRTARIKKKTYCYQWLICLMVLLISAGIVCYQSAKPSQ
jgi:Cys-tRNA synthase (O-phospho-L-seryl-tRNA:Cys-tRNA synthase)